MDVATMRLPSVLRRAVAAPAVVVADAATVGGLIDVVDTCYPGLRSRILAEDGQPHRYVSIFVDGEDLGSTGGLPGAIGNDTVVTVLPAIAGGSQPYDAISGSVIK